MGHCSYSRCRRCCDFFRVQFTEDVRIFGRSLDTRWFNAFVLAGLCTIMRIDRTGPGRRRWSCSRAWKSQMPQIETANHHRSLYNALSMMLQQRPRRNSWTSHELQYVVKASQQLALSSVNFLRAVDEDHLFLLLRADPTIASQMAFRVPFRSQSLRVTTANTVAWMTRSCACSSEGGDANKRELGHWSGRAGSDQDAERFFWHEAKAWAVAS